jgi:predicted nucleic acid-binding protein
MTVDPLLDDDRAAITGMILAEILQGFRRDDQADWVASSLNGLHTLEPTWDDWRYVAKLGRQLIASGHRLPLTDLAIAAIALRNDCFVLTTDPHFDLIAGLKRFPLQ